MKKKKVNGWLDLLLSFYREKLKNRDTWHKLKRKKGKKHSERDA